MAHFYLEVEMNNVIYIYLICILIEVYHIVFHKFVYSIEGGILKAFKTLDKFHKGLKYCAEAGSKWNDSPELLNSIGEFPCVMNEEAINNYVYNSKRKLISLYDSKYIAKFLFEQFIELLYWAFSVLIVIKDFPRGIIIFAALMILSHMHKNYNDFKYFYLFDSLFCIVMYVTCITTLV